jgi:2-keto-4-pentenoate hydratase/2-oxohepta-3-ene-1,7-dioic acid hydratase in catechol pathway
MKVGLASIDGSIRSVVIGEPDVIILPLGAPTPDDVVRSPAALAQARSLALHAPRQDRDSVHLLAPLRAFNRDILCTGWNYWDHFFESAGRRQGQEPAEAPEHPTFFTKGPLSLTGPYEPIPFDPTISVQWDYEAELAIVIGKAGRSIPESRAAEHVAGVLVANDISQRDVQRAHGGQWLKGKSLDATTPIGPWLTTWDEVADVQDLDISFELNGVLMQSASTSEMAFSISRVIAELSWGMTLLPGDLILTGTPSGIGNARTPQEFLTEGDLLVTRIGGLGELRNRVAVASLSEYVAG